MTSIAWLSNVGEIFSYDLSSNQCKVGGFFYINSFIKPDKGRTNNNKFISY